MKSSLLDIQAEANTTGFVLLSDLLLSKGLYKTGLCSTLKLLSSLKHPTPPGMTYPDTGGEQLSFLDQLKIRYEMLIGDTGDPISVYDALVMLACSFGGRIFYSNNSYHFQRIVDLFTEMPAVATYTDKDYPDSREIVAIRKVLGGELDSSAAIYVNNDAFIQIGAAYKQGKIEVDYTLRGYLQNGMWSGVFVDSGITSFYNWNTNTYQSDPDIGPTPAQGLIAQHGNGSFANPYCCFMEAYPSDTAFIWQKVSDIKIHQVYTLKFRVRFYGYKRMAYQIHLWVNIEEPVNYTHYCFDGVKWVHIKDAPSSPLHLKGNPDYNIFIDRPDVLKDNEVSVEIELPKTPDTLFPPAIGYDPTAASNTIDIAFIDPDIPVNDGATQPGVEILPVEFSTKPYGYTGEIDTMRSPDNYSMLKETDIKLVDGLDAFANSIHYGEYGVKKIDFGYWEDGFINPETIQEYVISLGLPPIQAGVLLSLLEYEPIQIRNLRQILGANSKPYYNLETSVYSNTLSFESTIQANIRGASKVFLQMSDQYDVRSCIHKLQLLEITDPDGLTAVAKSKYKM